MEDYLYGTKDVMRYSGLCLQRIKTEIAYRGFPKPIGQRKHGRYLCNIWRRDDVKKWCDANPRRQVNGATKKPEQNDGAQLRETSESIPSGV